MKDFRSPTSILVCKANDRCCYAHFEESPILMELIKKLSPMTMDIDFVPNDIGIIGDLPFDLSESLDETNVRVGDIVFLGGREIAICLSETAINCALIARFGRVDLLKEMLEENKEKTQMEFYIEWGE